MGFTQAKRDHRVLTKMSNTFELTHFEKNFNLEFLLKDKHLKRQIECMMKNNYDYEIEKITPQGKITSTSSIATSKHRYPNCYTNMDEWQKPKWPISEPFRKHLTNMQMAKVM